MVELGQDQHVSRTNQNKAGRRVCLRFFAAATDVFVPNRNRQSINRNACIMGGRSDDCGRMETQTPDRLGVGQRTRPPNRY